jgi:hypothetical protein
LRFLAFQLYPCCLEVLLQIVKLLVA